MPNSSGTNTQKILLLGDVSRAFLDAGTVHSPEFEVYSDVAEGVEAAAKNNFAVIGVVMAGLSPKLSLILKILREVNAHAKIVLLAQMWEEPVAIQLIDTSNGHTSAADDYLICPVRTDQLREFIMPTQGKKAVETVTQTVVTPSIESKIRHLERLATEDDLTGLKNRRYIREFSRQIIERARKENGRVTLLIFDIDNLKQYNDIYGHSAGDEILRQVAVLIQRCCRGHDVVGRIGGDEFAVVFWDEPQAVAEVPADDRERRSAMAEHPKEVVSIAKRFQKELGKAEFHLLGPEGKGVLTISGGLASLGPGCSTAQELFEQADKALLIAKRSGKNRIYIIGRPEGNIADVG
jgi:diguanylate cyclase (GGDEF)-like protein